MGNFYGTPRGTPARRAPILVGCGEPWLTFIKQGHKVVEGRRATPKWAGLKAGDILAFADLGAGGLQQSVAGFGVEITEVHRYPPGPGALRRFLAAEELSKLLPGVSTLEKAERVYLGWAPLEEYEKTGMVALRFRPLETVTPAPFAADTPAADGASSASDDSGNDSDGPTTASDSDTDSGQVDSSDESGTETEDEAETETEDKAEPKAEIEKGAKDEAETEAETENGAKDETEAEAEAEAEAETENGAKDAPDPSAGEDEAS